MLGTCRACRAPFEFFRPTAGMFAPTMCPECIEKRRTRLVTLTGVVTRTGDHFIYIVAIAAGRRHQYRGFPDGPGFFISVRETPGSAGETPRV